MTEENTQPQDDQTIPEIEKEVLGDDQTPSELATDTTQQEELISKEKSDKAINKKHFQFKEEERGHAETKRLLDEANLKIAESNKTARPVVPPMPDQFDDDYDAKVNAVRKAEREQGAYDQQQTNLFNQQQTAQQQKQIEANELADKSVKDFYSRASELKIDQTKLVESENIVAQYVTNRDVAQFLLKDKDGPQMVNYLAANPVELEKVAGMTPMNAALYLRNDVSIKALKRNQSNAPDPDEELGGRKTTETEDPYMKGVKYR